MPVLDINNDIYLSLQRKLLEEQFDDIEKYKFYSKHNFTVHDVEMLLDDIRVEFLFSVTDVIKGNENYEKRKEKYIQEKLSEI